MVVAVVVRQSDEWNVSVLVSVVDVVVEEVEKEKEEKAEGTGRSRPREKGEKGVNFLSVKTPLEREKRRCLLLVILGEKMEG